MACKDGDIRIRNPSPAQDDHGQMSLQGNDRQSHQGSGGHSGWGTASDRAEANQDHHGGWEILDSWIQVAWSAEQEQLFQTEGSRMAHSRPTRKCGRYMS